MRVSFEEFDMSAAFLHVRYILELSIQWILIQKISQNRLNVAAVRLLEHLLERAEPPLVPFKCKYLPHHTSKYIPTSPG